VIRRLVQFLVLCNLWHHKQTESRLRVFHVRVNISQHIDTRRHRPHGTLIACVYLVMNCGFETAVLGRTDFYFIIKLLKKLTVVYTFNIVHSTCSCPLPATVFHFSCTVDFTAPLCVGCKPQPSSGATSV
jgi:hypothetical protein